MSNQRRLMDRGVRIVPWALLVVLMLAGTLWSIDGAPPVSAQQFTLTGLAECGQKSGSRCRDYNAIGLLTDDSGARTRYRLNFDWIPGKDLPGLDQDDLIEIEVEVMPDGQLRVLRLVDPNERQDDERKKKEQGKEESSGRPEPTQVVITTTTTTATTTSTITSTSTFIFGTFDGTTSTCIGLQSDELLGAQLTVTITSTSTVTITQYTTTFTTTTVSGCRFV